MIRDGITYRGQKYVDEPITESAKPSPIASGVAGIFQREVPTITQVVGHQRVRLNWVKPTTFEELRYGKPSKYAR